MKKFSISVLVLSFFVTISYANDGFGFSEDFISQLKKKSGPVLNDQHEISMLDRKLRNHFTFITILKQDWTDELMMSLKSEINTEVEANHDKWMKDVNNENSTKSSMKTDELQSLIPGRQ